jgi:hypothetical protein
MAVAIVLFFLTFAGLADAQTSRHHHKRWRRSGAVKTASGLIYLITQKGTGRLPKKGETVLVNYTGTLTSGLKFDSSLDRGATPLPFTLGAGEVIKGWDEGVSKLHIGDKAILVIPPGIAYGVKGAGNVIPPNSTLIFIVELMDIKAGSLSKLLFETLKTGGSDAMLARYRELKAKGLGDIYTSESDLNGLGYRLLRLKQNDNAITVFKLIVDEYPNSANAYDSLGEAYIAARQRQLAIDAYEKALTIDPAFPSAIAALKKLRSAP